MPYSFVGGSGENGNSGVNNGIKPSENGSPSFKDPPPILNQGIVFGEQIHIDINLLEERRYQLELLVKILKKNCYFSPIYYKYDPDQRIISTLDNLISIKLDFNFILIDQRVLFYILSVLQLSVLGLIQDNVKLNNIIEKILASLKLKIELMNTKSSTKWITITRSMFGKIDKTMHFRITAEDESDLKRIVKSIIIELKENGFLVRPTNLIDDS